MAWRTQSLPQPVNLLVCRALALCETMLSHSSHLYPFAAIYEQGRIGCLFTDEEDEDEEQAQLIEKLQWRIIDTTTDAESYSLLAFAATVVTPYDGHLDVVAITVTTPQGNERQLLCPYRWVDNRVVFSEPFEG